MADAIVAHICIMLYHCWCRLVGGNCMHRAIHLIKYLILAVILMFYKADIGGKCLVHVSLSKQAALKQCPSMMRLLCNFSIVIQMHGCYDME